MKPEEPEEETALDHDFDGGRGQYLDSWDEPNSDCPIDSGGGA